MAPPAGWETVDGRNDTGIPDGYWAVGGGRKVSGADDA